MKILASVSHELRTPLNCSISMLEILYNSKEIPLELRENIILPALCSN